MLSAAQCWGDGSVGETDSTLNVTGLGAPVPGPFTQLSAGQFHTCALRGPAGAIRCWGDNAVGELNGVPGGATGPTGPAGVFTDVSAGGLHSCGLLSVTKRARCWGSDQFGQLDGVPSGLTTIATPALAFGTFKQITAGLFHTCGLRVNGLVKCWGSNTSRQLGPPPCAAILHVCNLPAVFGHFVQISAGGYHTCGILVGGLTIKCWGSDGFGQLNGVPGAAITGVVPAPALHTFTQVTAGAYHTCALESPGGKVLCWGLNNDGQLNGAPSGLHKGSPPGVFVQISAGGYHTCGATTGIPATEQVVCWGLDTRGQLDTTPSAAIHLAPVPLPLL